MTNTTITVPLTVQLPNEDVDDIVGTASYGGITYWASEADAASRQKVYAAHPDTALVVRDGDGQVVSCTRDAIRQAVRALIVNDPHLIGPAVHDYMLAAVRDGEDGRLELGHVDADAADCIVQVALFGEVVYG